MKTRQTVRKPGERVCLCVSELGYLKISFADIGVEDRYYNVACNAGHHGFMDEDGIM